MMKRLLLILLAAGILGSTAACGKLRRETAIPETTETYITEPTAAEPGEGTAERVSTEAFAPSEEISKTEAPEPAVVTDPSGVDVDLTVLSSTMVYAEVLNMMTEPNAYDGKTVKMRGRFGASYGYRPDGTINEDVLIFACIIADATACCSQGIEFVLSGAYTFPEDYPELDSEITVTGTFKSGEQNGIPYFRVINAQMTV